MLLKSITLVNFFFSYPLWGFLAFSNNDYLVYRLPYKMEEGGGKRVKLLVELLGVEYGVNGMIWVV